MVAQEGGNTLVKELDKKAEAEDRKSRPWAGFASVLAVGWMGALFANIASTVLYKKPLFKRGFGGWDEPISKTEGVVIAAMGTSAIVAHGPAARASAYRDAIDHIKAVEAHQSASDTDTQAWKQKIAGEPSDPLASSPVKR